MTTGPRPTSAERNLKCACGELWSHPAVRLLVGDALRPGGAQLTGLLLDRLALPAGSRVLDVGGGPGSTLDASRARGLRAVGVDYSEAQAREADAVGHAVVADGEQLPFSAGAFDAVVMECVLSLLPDKRSALGDARRVLTPGGHVVVTDVTKGGGLPEPLASVLGWIGCVQGALEAERYRDLLVAAGFSVTAVQDHRQELRSFVAKVRRRLALLQGAAAVGVTEPSAPTRALPLGAPGPGNPLARLAEHVFAQLSAALDDGQLGYVAITARSRSRR